MLLSSAGFLFTSCSSGKYWQCKGTEAAALHLTPVLVVLRVQGRNNVDHGLEPNLGWLAGLSQLDKTNFRCLRAQS